MIRYGDTVRLTEHIDEGCYKCPQKGDIGIVWDIENTNDRTWPYIGVKFDHYAKVTYFTEDELEAVE